MPQVSRLPLCPTILNVEKHERSKGSLHESSGQLVEEVVTKKSTMQTDWLPTLSGFAAKSPATEQRWVRLYVAPPLIIVAPPLDNRRTPLIPFLLIVVPSHIFSTNRRTLPSV
jgi:hypothetical protein